MQFYNSEIESMAQSIIYDNLKDSETCKDIMMFHQAIYNMLVQNIIYAKEMFHKLGCSNNRHIRLLARKNYRVASCYIKNSKIGFEVKKGKTKQEDNLESQAIVQTRWLDGELFITDNTEFADKNASFVVCKLLGKKVNILDRKGNIVKSTLPVFDDIQIDKSSIFCTQIIPNMKVIAYNCVSYLTRTLILRMLQQWSDMKYIMCCFYKAFPIDVYDFRCCAFIDGGASGHELFDPFF